MATTSPQASRQPEETDNPGQDKFDELIEREFSPGDEIMMEERARKGAQEDAEQTDQTPSRDEISDAEETAGETKQSSYENQVGKGYQKRNAQPGFIRRSLGRHNRIFLIGGSSSAIIIILIVIFLSLLPFKILHIVNNLQSHFFSTSENAVQKETNSLYSDYIRKYVMPALRKCPTNIDRSCNPINGGTLVSQLYKGWRNAKFEDKIASKYGLEFRYSQISKHYYLKAPGLTGDGIDLGDQNSGFAVSTDSIDEYLTKSNDSQFTRVSRSQLRAAINDALEKESGWKRVMYRFKVGRLLEKKYGFKRCIFACDTQDNFADWRDNKVRAAKLILAERVLRPRSESLYLIVACVITGSPSCDPAHRTVSGAGINGEPATPIEKDLADALDKLALEESGKYADVLANSQDILKDGYAKFLAKKIVVLLGGDATKAETAQEITSDLVPVVGWVNASANTIKLLENTNELKAYAYITNATGMIATYATYRTYADEIKTGHVDGALVGSMTDSLGAGSHDSTGGVASAEQAPLYGYLIDGDLNSSGQAISSLLGKQAYAASTDPTYKCESGKSPPAGQLICPEEVLGGANIPAVAYANDILNALKPVKALADVWNSTFGKIFGLAGSVAGSVIGAISKLTGFNGVLSAIAGAFKPIIQAFVDFLIPNPFSDNMAGGRTFDLAAGGADQLNSDFSQNGLGGRKLTSQQASAILTEQDQQDYQLYKSKPLFSRIFDTSTNYSLVSKLAMQIPDSAKAASNSITTAIFSNPFDKLAKIFTPIFNNQAYAVAGMFPDPFGIPQYGYPDNDPALAAANMAPETYWSSNCSTDGTTLDWNDSSKENAKWVAAATVDPDTGLPEDDTTNPCMLIDATVGSAGAIYNSSLLTQDDLGSQ